MWLKKSKLAESLKFIFRFGLKSLFCFLLLLIYVILLGLLYIFTILCTVLTFWLIPRNYKLHKANAYFSPKLVSFLKIRSKFFSFTTVKIMKVVWFSQLVLFMYFLFIFFFLRYRFRQEQHIEFINCNKILMEISGWIFNLEK